MEDEMWTSVSHRKIMKNPVPNIDKPSLSIVIVFHCVCFFVVYCGFSILSSFTAVVSNFGYCLRRRRRRRRSRRRHPWFLVKYGKLDSEERARYGCQSGFSVLGLNTSRGSLQAVCSFSSVRPISSPRFIALGNELNGRTHHLSGAAGKRSCRQWNPALTQLKTARLCCCFLLSFCPATLLGWKGSQVLEGIVGKWEKIWTPTIDFLRPGRQAKADFDAKAWFCKGMGPLYTCGRLLEYVGSHVIDSWM